MPVVVMSLGVAKPHILMFLGFAFSVPWTLHIKSGQIYLYWIRTYQIQQGKHLAKARM